MVALIALIGFGGGFIPATAVLFAATARAFGRRALLADLGIGFAIGLIAFCCSPSCSPCPCPWDRSKT